MGSSKCLISQNIRCLIKTPLKHCTQTIFQGGSPWATLILNSMIVVGVHYCVKLFLGWPFSKISLPFTMAFVSWFLSSILLGIKQVFPKSKGWISIRIKIPWLTLIFNSMIGVWVLFCVQLFLWDDSFFFCLSLSPFLYYSFCLLLCSILLAPSPWFIWCFFGISMGFHHISMKFLWCFYDISIGFQKGVRGISGGFL